MMTAGRVSITAIPQTKRWYKTLLDKPSVQLISADQLSKLPPTQRLGKTKFIATGLNVVYGPSGSFKSFYVLDALLGLAQAQPVVYVAGEGVGGLHNRVEAWCAYNKLSAGQSYFIPHAINLLKPSAVRELCEILKKLNPVAVVFDTLARCASGGDENSAKDMGRAVASSDYIRQMLGASSIWVHHTNKAERGERGSGAIRGAADNMVEIFPNGDGSVKVSCSKSKDEEHWVDEQLSFQAVLNSGVLVSTNGYATLEYSDLEMRVLEFLSLETFQTAGARVVQMVNALNIPERSIYRILSHLKKDCQIQQSKSGDPYYLTDLGKMTLAYPSANSHVDVDFVVKDGVN